MVIQVLSALLIVAGTVFLLASALGVLRLPDFYSRLHAAGKGDTLGQALVLLGLILMAGATLVSVKLAFIVAFIFVFNPTATHALARGAWLSGLRPWTGQKERPFEQREGQLTAAEKDALFEAGRQSVAGPDAQGAGDA